MISEETRQKLRDSHKGQIPWNKGIKTNNKFWLGKKRSEDTKEKLRIASKRRLERDGYLIPPESRKKASEKMRGENHFGWKGGISFDKKKYQRDRYSKMSSEEKKKISFEKNKRNSIKRKINKEGSNHTYLEWMSLQKKYGFTCPSCKKKEPEIKLTEDHIIPLSLGGSDEIKNIQPLCSRCNCSKHKKIIKYFLPIEGMIESLHFLEINDAFRIFFIDKLEGETSKFRQEIIFPEDSISKFLFLALRDSMNKSSWAEVSKYPDVSTVNKKFA